MTSDQIKDEVIRKIQQACISWATTEQMQIIERAAILALHNVELSMEETAVSCTFAKPNEWYGDQFLAIKAVQGLSPRSLKTYKATITKFFEIVEKAIPEVTTNKEG